MAIPIGMVAKDEPVACAQVDVRRHQLLSAGRH